MRRMSWRISSVTGRPGVEFAVLLAADGAVDQPGHVALCVLQIEILRTIVCDGHGADLIVGKMQSCAAVRLNNSDLRQYVAKVGIACLHGLTHIDNLAAGIAGLVNTRIGGWCRHAAPARF